MIKVHRQRHRFGASLAAVGAAVLACAAVLFAPNKVQAAACAPAWVAATAYVQGNTVSENGINYIANWWTQGEDPATHNGGAGSGMSWTSQGACGGATCAAAPGAPTGLSASGTTSTSTNLSWSAVTPPANCTITSYTIFRGGTSIGTATGTTFAVTGLTASTTYSFTVSATDSFGAGGQSTAVSVTTASASCATKPSAPTGLSASGTTSTGTNLSWTAVSAPTGCSISGYTVYKAGTAIGTATGTTFAVTGLTASTTYSFTVAAIDAAGTGTASSALSVTTSAGASCTATPSAPTGLAASGTTSSSTSLSWSAVTAPANCTISGYTVYNGATAVTTVSSGTSYTVTGLTASTTYSFTVAAVDAAGTGTKSSAVSVTTSSGTSSCTAAAWNATTAFTTGQQCQYGGYLWQALYWTQNNVPQGGSSSPWNCVGYCGSLPGPAAVRKSMPYVDVTLIAPYNSLSSSVSKYYTMAFVTDMGGCTPAWAGKAVSTNQLSLADVNALRSAGGDVSLSFGGATGTELAGSCSSVAATQAAYQSVINIYHLTQIDFDIENGVGNTTANDQRAKAIKALQTANPGLRVTFTLPIETYGLDAAPLSLVQNAISNGVNIYAVNGMTMDFGGSYDHGGAMYLDQQLTAWSLMSQLQTLYPSKTHAQIAAMVSLTPMIGVNDNPAEIFTTQNATDTVTFSKAQGIGELGFWAESRDHSCASGETNYLCSSISQSAHQFASIFNGFNN